MFSVLPSRLAASLALVAAAGVAGCDEGAPTLRAFKVAERGQLIGGPGAVGQVGDYMLENDQVRAVVLGPRTTDHSAGPGIFGGGLADIDLVRSSAEFRGGRGLDTFAEMFPLANLKFQDPPDLGVEVVSDGADGGEARIRVLARSSLIFQAIGALFSFAGNMGIPADIQGEFCFRTDYSLRPGQRVIWVETLITGRPSGVAPLAGDPDICTIEPSPEDVLDLDGLEAENARGVFDVVFGSEGAEGAEGVEGAASDAGAFAGVVAGDFLYFGHTTSVFGPGVGFDKDQAMYEATESGTDTFAEPLAFPALIGVGDRVSYAVGAGSVLPNGRLGGDLLVPIFLSSATVTLSGVHSCSRGIEDDDSCDRYRHWRFRRMVGVGEGDVASAWAPVLRAQGEATGVLKGAIHDGRSGGPVPGAEVFLLRVPDLDPGERLRFRAGDLPYERYLASLAAQSKPGENGVVNQLLADRGTDPIRDGRFHGVVPAGRYAAVAYAEGRSPSNPVPVTVTTGRTTEVALTLPAQGVLEWLAVDQTGEHIPVKVVILPVDGGAVVRPELGDSQLIDGIYAVRFDDDGRGRISLPGPGKYDVIVMRGFEYEVHRETVTVSPGRTTRIHAMVERTVDTAGWLSADMHVHARPSFDSGVTLRERAVTMAAEGVEYFVATDHDVITDYGPAIRAAGLERYVAADPGVETTTIELGHFIGFPMIYDLGKAPTHGAPDWWGRSPHAVVDSLRAVGRRGPNGTVITLPHPRDGFFGYFDQFGLDPYSLKKETPMLGELGNPLQRSPSCDFDSIEVLNGKRYEFIRTPTVGESLGFMRERRKIRNEWAHDPVVRREKMVAINEKYTRLILERTAEEQAAWLGPVDACDVVRRLEADEDPGNWEPADGPEYDSPCDDTALEGVLDDWFGLLLGTRPDAVGAPAHDRLLAPTGLANSDTHGKTGVEAGFPRNWVRVEGSPARLDRDAVADAVLQRKVTAGAGPFVELWVNGAGVGEVVRGEGAHRVRVRVQSPSWFSVTRVETYRNAELIRVDELPADGSARRGAVDLDVSFEDDPGQLDVFYVVIAMGSHPTLSRMAPYYTSTPIPPLQFSDAAVGALSSTALGSLLGGGSADVPRHGVSWPYSFTNPVWVDGDGDSGWTPPREARMEFCEAAPIEAPAAPPVRRRRAPHAH